MNALKQAYPYPYSVDKAKALVKQLGGTLNVQLSISGRGASSADESRGVGLYSGVVVQATAAFTCGLCSA